MRRRPGRHARRGAAKPRSAGRRRTASARGENERRPAEAAPALALSTTRGTRDGNQLYRSERARLSLPIRARGGGRERRSDRRGLPRRPPVPTVQPLGPARTAPAPRPRARLPLPARERTARRRRSRGDRDRGGFPVRGPALRRAPHHGRVARGHVRPERAARALARGGKPRRAVHAPRSPVWTGWPYHKARRLLLGYEAKGRHYLGLLDRSPALTLLDRTTTSVDRCDVCGLEKATWKGQGVHLCETCYQRESRRAVEAGEVVAEG